jgi:hypothetical protein
MNDIDDDAADELTLRYRRASASDPSRPSLQTRAAIGAQARTAMTFRSSRAADEAALAQLESSPAANDSRWKLRAVAGLAGVGLAGLLATQAFHQAPRQDPPGTGLVAQSISPPPATFPVSDARTRDAEADRSEAAPRAASVERAMKASNAQAVAPAAGSRVAPGSALPAAPAAASLLAESSRLERASVNAATNSGQQSPAVSRAIEQPLKAAQDAMNARNYDAALALLEQAQAMPGKSSFDQFVINEFLGPIYARQNKYAEAYEAFSANADSPYLTQGKADRYKVLATLASSLKNYPSAVEWGNKAIAAGINSDDVLLIVAQSYFLQNKYVEAAASTQELVARAELASRRPQEANLKLLWECYRKLNDGVAEARVIEKLLTYYPKPDYWANAMASLQQMSNHNDRLTLQTYRVMQDVGTLKRSDQYAEMAQLAQEQGFPGEAQTVLEQGMAKNVFIEQREKERAGRLLEAATKLAVTAKQGLPRDEQAAATAPNGEALVAVGSSYLINANDPATAVRLITQGISQGGVGNMNDAYVNLGLAQMRNRNISEARRAFVSVTGSEAYEHLARLWLLRLR